MNLIKISIIAASIAVCATSTNAGTGDIPFSGSIGSTCIINALSSGTLQVDATLQNLNSLANPATAEVIATSSGFSLSMDTPSLTRPAADTTPLNSIGGAYHPISFSGDNSSLVNAFDTTPPQALNAGRVSLNVFFFSGKTGNNIFAEGTYTADVVLRCE
ncbi:MAG: hypothetical protein AAF423_12850 [Pseudomonadota bacterium]